MATNQEIAAIARTLNGVTTAGQAQVVIGRTLVAIHNAYPITEKLPDDRAAAGAHELDIARQGLQAWYDQIKNLSPAAPYKKEFAGKRRLVEAAYVTIGGIEAAANYQPVTSNLAILQQSLAEAPQVFGDAVAKVTNEVGKVAGSTVGGVLGGLGLSGTVTLLVVGAVVLLIFTRGTILGQALRLIGGSK